MSPEYTVAPVLDLADLVLNPYQLAFSVIHSRRTEGAPDTIAKGPPMTGSNRRRANETELR
jgi:hypothetical protein